jgi:hypothetical protein
MDKSDAMAIAKSKKSTPEQLKKAMGHGDEVNRLLAKHPNASAEILDELSCEWDEKTVQSVTEHPNTPHELLDNLGDFHPLSLFKNPNLPALLKKDKNYLGRFYGEPFEEALKQKNLPKLVIDWLAKHGKAEYQAIFLFGAQRPPELAAQFRQSKHPAILAKLLQRDDATYLAWASDLGYQTLPPTADDELSGLRSQLDDWVEELWQHNQKLWAELVPKSGSAASLQGELVRALSRIETEYFRNGMMNWGDGYYEQLTALLHSTLKDEKSFTPLVKKILDADIAQIKRSGITGKAIASGKKPRSAAFGGSILVEGDVEKSHERIGALITLWCQRHPELIPYQAPQ